MNKVMNRFDEITHTPLRVYNRAVMALNICEDFGKEDAGEYLASFSPEEKLQIAMYIQFMEHFGHDAGRDAATKGATFEYNAGDPDYKSADEDQEAA